VIPERREVGRCLKSTLKIYRTISHLLFVLSWFNLPIYYENERLTTALPWPATAWLPPQQLHFSFAAVTARRKWLYSSTKRFVEIASATKDCCWDKYQLLQPYMLPLQTVVCVTSESVTTTILVCWGYINKMFCWGNEVIFSVWCREMSDITLSNFDITLNSLKIGYRYLMPRSARLGAKVEI